METEVNGLKYDFMTQDGMTYYLRCHKCGLEWIDNDGSCPVCPICDKQYYDVLKQTKEYLHETN